MQVFRSLLLLLASVLLLILFIHYVLITILLFLVVKLVSTKSSVIVNSLRCFLITSLTIEPMLFYRVMMILVPFFHWKLSFWITSNDIEASLISIMYVSIWKSTFIIVKRFLSFFLLNFLGFLFHIAHSDAYFSFYIEISVENRKDLQEIIDAEDNNAVCFVSGIGFGCWGVSGKAREHFLGCCDVKKPKLCDDWLAVGCCFFDFLGNQWMEMTNVLVVWLGSCWKVVLMLLSLSSSSFWYHSHQQSSCLHLIEKRLTTINRGNG